MFGLSPWRQTVYNPPAYGYHIYLDNYYIFRRDDVFSILGRNCSPHGVGNKICVIFVVTKLLRPTKRTGLCKQCCHALRCLWGILAEIQESSAEQ